MTVSSNAVDHMRNKATRIEQQARNLMHDYEYHSQNHDYIFQPYGVSPSFDKKRERIRKKYEKGVKLLDEANALRKRANNREHRDYVTSQGGAEAIRKRQREENDRQVQVGDTVVHRRHGVGVVVKVNKKTYTLRMDGEHPQPWKRDGSVTWTHAFDKSEVTKE